MEVIFLGMLNYLYSNTDNFWGNTWRYISSEYNINNPKEEYRPCHFLVNMVMRMFNVIGPRLVIYITVPL